MKLIQRIVLNYYRTKLKAIEIFSLSKAAASAFELFCTPYSRQKVKQIPDIFKQAEKISFTFQNHNIHGFRWKAATENALKILICHGFDSRSYRFEKYVRPLLNTGFEILAFDAPAHGLSSGKTINAVLYSDMIGEINRTYGPVSGIMAHSFGGIAVALAIERMKLPLLKRLVPIAPATETTRSLNDFCRYLKISSKLKASLEEIIIQTSGNPASWYSVARIIQSVTIPTLWLHDKNDKITPYEDMQLLTTLNLPFVRFVITNGLGHSLYRDENIGEQIISFLSIIQKGV